MCDSDEEYDRKRRDKFRGERSAGSDGYRAERRDDRRICLGGSNGGRDDCAERNPFRSSGGGGRPRPEYRDYRAPRDRYSSPGGDLPPAKRMRPEWADDIRGAIPRYSYDSYLMHTWNDHYAHSHHNAYAHTGGAGGNHAASSREPVGLVTQPPMKTIKQFLYTQDDGISDGEVLRKYGEYKYEFKSEQINDFFVAHEDEEWFKNKYHPVDSALRKEEQLAFLKRRVEVFIELLRNGSIKAVTVDTSQTELLVRLLDTVVIMLEGGTDDDLRILGEKPKELMQFPEQTFQGKNPDIEDEFIITPVEKMPDILCESLEVLPIVVSSASMPILLSSDDQENVVDNGENDSPVKAKEEVIAEKEPSVGEENTRERREKSSDSSTTSSSDTDSSSSSSSEEDDEENRNGYNFKDIILEQKEPEEEKENEKEKEKALEAEKPLNVEPRESTNSTEAIETETASVKVEKISESEELMTSTQPETVVDSSNAEDFKTEIEKELKDALSNASADKVNSKNVAEDTNENTDATENNGPATTTETIDLAAVNGGPTPRALHRTSSIFLRNVAPFITKEEIETVCKNYDGYLRVAIADPLVERRWYRRGWVTFQRDVNIKEICWNLNNTRLRDCELGAIVNRDLTRRVRPVSGMTAHKTIVLSDIKLCARITLSMDEKFKLWENVDKSADSTATGYGFHSNNPVLQNITDFLIEEASAEEDELLGLTREKKYTEGEVIERDPQLLSVLDTLILYLRIVHSVDFYNHCEYPNEDEMPNRCGIIHARGPTPTRIAQNDIEDYIKNFDSKMQHFLIKPPNINEKELKNLGYKDTEAEVEKFIQENCHELSKDKWLCPLSGKKFKSPEFIRKHIFNRHLEKIEKVKQEAEFFNNYLRDPKRPQLPEHPGLPKRTNLEPSSSGNAIYRPPVYPQPYPPQCTYAPPVVMPARGGRNFAGGRREMPMGHHRRMIAYHDLDSPANFDV